MTPVSIAIALLALAFSPLDASAQEDKCPQGYSNDDCDQWYFEQAEKALSEVVDSKG